ncbi:hypothetical protein [Exiguobacterium sp. s78]|nr:hypothetical protein [Exiguobacterium sp. s78]
MFTKDSYIVKVWLKQVEGGLSVEDVPDLSNLREVIKDIISNDQGDAK